MTTIESRVLKMISIRVDALGLVLTDEGKEALAGLTEGRP